LSDQLDKRDRRALRRLLAGKSTLESLPGYRREKLRSHLLEQADVDEAFQEPDVDPQGGYDTLAEKAMDRD
jgi:hypothetical protein